MSDMIFDPYNYPFWIIIIAIIMGVIAVLYRPFSTYVKFVYPNAKFEAMGNPFITDKELNRIVENKDLTGIKEFLNNLKDYKVEGDNIKDLQKSIDENFIKTIDMMKKDSSKKMKNFFDTYIEKMDTYLIKNAIKNKLNNKKIDTEIIDQTYLQSTKTFLSEIINFEKEKLSDIFKKYEFEEEIIMILKEENIDFLKLDTAIDKHYIDKFNKLKVPYKCGKAKDKFVRTIIDVTNIKNILRAKKLNYSNESMTQLFLGEGQEIAFWKFKEMSQIESIPQIISSLEGTSYFDVLKNQIDNYNKEGSIQIFENALESQYLKLIKNISFENYINIGPTIRFIVSKEFEIKNLKIIIKGIGESLTSEFIKSMLITEAN